MTAVPWWQWALCAPGIAFGLACVALDARQRRQAARKPATGRHARRPQ